MPQCGWGPSHSACFWLGLANGCGSVLNRLGTRRTVTCYFPRSDPQCHGSKIEEEADQGRGDEEKAVRCEHVTMEADQCKFIERLSFAGCDCDWDRGYDRDRGRGWKGIRLPEGDSGGRRRHKTEVRTNSFAHVRASPNPGPGPRTKKVSIGELEPKPGAEEETEAVVEAEGFDEETQCGTWFLLIDYVKRIAGKTSKLRT